MERKRLEEARTQHIPWRKWGPYLSERQWGTVREDFSENGDAWNYFTHDQARSRAYRWGEDGLAGISDDQQILCFALALWNGKDPILKERLFGLTNSEGNHGEDVKEYYFYLDSTPTHAYMKYLYKYPQGAYPYDELVRKNRERGRNDREYELLDTGIFDHDRYFDVFVEYAKAGPEDILIQITAANRGPEAAELQLAPALWFRNTWAKGNGTTAEKPMLEQAAGSAGISIIAANHPALGSYRLSCEGNPELLFTENETNNERIFGTPNASAYVKDGIHDHVVRGEQGAVNPEKRGTKAAVHHRLTLGAGMSAQIRLRLAATATPGPDAGSGDPDPVFGKAFDGILALRRQEADEFYREVTPASVSPDAATVMRQAIAGMLWSKQYYHFDVNQWLEEHHAHPLHRGSRPFRNREWFHMVNQDIILMPDKWEYPWYATWDLAFHTLPVSIVDPDFAKEQMILMLRGVYQHPSGQIPACEWNFSDVNPPIQAAVMLFLYQSAEVLRREGDIDVLKSAFNKLLLNFTWWVNRKDRAGRNVFEGGFLGLDNIGIFDRSAPLPTGGYLEQADGTAWMALFTLDMFGLATEIACHDRAYEDMAFKFFEHFLYIAAAMNQSDQGMWDEEDGFYYDLLRLPDGSATRVKVRSLVGLLPICATAVVEEWQHQRFPRVFDMLSFRVHQMPELLASIHPTGPGHFGVNQRGILALVNPERLRRILARMLDENEFLKSSRYPLAVQIPRAESLCLPYERSGIPHGLRAGGIEHRHVRRQFQLERPGLDADEPAHHPGPPAILSLLRRQF